MSNVEKQSWKAIQAEFRRRIASREWQSGEMIPGEAKLAEEFGCARATVNRALQGLADAGLLNRRRKAGTRVNKFPERKAVLTIPITRLEVEQRGASYSHTVLKSETRELSSAEAKRLGIEEGEQALHLVTMHYANRHPFLYEDRLLHLAAAPEAANIDFSVVSANEWLVRNTAFTHGEVDFFAADATKEEASHLRITENTSILVVERKTWLQSIPITNVRMAYAPGYRMHMEI